MHKTQWTVTRADTWVWEIQLTKAGTLIPITGMAAATEITLTVRRTADDLVASVIGLKSGGEITVTDDVNGILAISIPFSDTNIFPGAYWGDIQIDFLDGTRRSAGPFPVVVKADITHA